MASQASLLLQKQLKDLCKNPVDGFSAGLVDETNIFEWSVTIIGPPDTLYDDLVASLFWGFGFPPKNHVFNYTYRGVLQSFMLFFFLNRWGGFFFCPDTVESLSEGGFFNAIMSFPPNYPNSPPSVKFTSELWHPNVYPDGRVCISILHPPGDDPNGYELASERWTPVHTVESIVLSIISMLSSPNDESPANVEAAEGYIAGGVGGGVGVEPWRIDPTPTGPHCLILRLVRQVKRSGEIGEMNSRRRLADVCGSHKKCCDLQLGFSSSFCEQKDIQLNVWIGSPVTVEPSIVPFVLEKPTVF
ncbi:hypothetical protein JHK85_038773 [Glycine max]|nr:hypothetical protein JHK85_038773 [Glycine max]